MELYRLTAAELSRMIRNKEVSSTEVTKSVFSRIKEKENEIEAYVTLNEEGALKKAAEVDEKIARGENLSSLAGIPVGIKDNICTKGLRTTCSSKMLSNFVPPYNATVINKLEAADFVCSGKLNMDEFAMGSSTETSFFKKTKTPLIPPAFPVARPAVPLRLLPAVKQLSLWAVIPAVLSVSLLPSVALSV